MHSVIRRVTWDIETMAVVSREVSSYDGPWELCKESDAEKSAQANMNSFTSGLQTMMKGVFASQQGILNVINPQLEAMAANPQGFGATEYAALQSQIINDTGAQYSNEAKAEATAFATENEAGLPSGVEQQVQASLKGAAAGQVASQSTALAVANEQLKQQQQQFALSSLGAEQSGLGSEATSLSGTTLSGLNSEFSQAQAVYNQGSLWQNILGGVMGAAGNIGMDFLTGGASSLMQGNSFLEGGMSGAFNPSGK